MPSQKNEYRFWKPLKFCIFWYNSQRAIRHVRGFSRDLYWYSMRTVNNHFGRLLTILQTWFIRNENLTPDSWSASKTEYKNVLWWNIKFTKWSNFCYVKIVWKNLRVYTYEHVCILMWFFVAEGERKCLVLFWTTGLEALKVSS
jgi:hypothetical protein